MRRRLGAPFACLLLVSACASASHAPASPRAPTAGAGMDEPAPVAPPAPPAPWSTGALAASDVPAVYLTEWRKAENRTACALLAVSSDNPGGAADAGAVGTGAVGTGAVARAATFSGGWAVAYDLPDQRSAFGVAGTGVAAADQTYDEWPWRITWSDGSTAGYGPEGGSSPNQLAYLRIAGQGCLYNVWSRLGRTHLEQLLSRLRFVQT